MNGEERNLALQNGVLEWQKKYGIRDGDPILASLELFHLYLRTNEPTTHGTAKESYPPTFGEFRESIEILDQRARTFAKHATELIQELRKLPENKMRSGGSFTIFLLLALSAGIAIGRFFL